MAVGERLKQAIETHAGISIREFHRRMGPDGRGVSGASYPNIHRYLKERVEPSLEFLRQAAEECGVRQEWLIVGAGLP
ncbi:MAG: helix-turn-helix transcriptional regulator, partial [Nitrospinae bacterium]|nr:helix-turn-helix transcriptional regulator [Nitrospinota bacterium]